MNLTDEELKVLKAYFEVTNINISALAHKIGVKNVKDFNKVLDKIMAI